ncbi:hypothetical protein [Alteromonas sp. BZK5]|uniref:hypothetical protein n=1 Tax=Alteromonas sp. BZK5 TaxID=1904459 RepID=UPI001653D0D5|nr:hypothetical protein [Alteromonas sp. BZK5]MBC6987655.1 hypothetical protein [Alteromonas sp. BZK5]
MSSVNPFTPNMTGYRLVSSVPDDDCGCLEEEWECPVGVMSFHLRQNGFAEVIFDNGECEWEIEIHGGSVNGFWMKVMNYIDSLPVLDI